MARAPVQHIYLVFRHFGTQYLWPSAVVKYFSTHSTHARTEEGEIRSGSGSGSGYGIGGKTRLLFAYFLA